MAPGIDEGFVPAPTDVWQEQVAGDLLLWADGFPPVVLDQAGALSWELFDGSASLGELADDIAAELGADRGEVLAGLVRVARSLEASGCLTGGDTPPVGFNPPSLDLVRTDLGLADDRAPLWVSAGLDRGMSASVALDGGEVSIGFADPRLAERFAARREGVRLASAGAANLFSVRSEDRGPARGRFRLLTARGVELHRCGGNDEHLRALDEALRAISEMAAGGETWLPMRVALRGGGATLYTPVLERALPGLWSRLERLGFERSVAWRAAARQGDDGDVVVRVEDHQYPIRQVIMLPDISTPRTPAGVAWELLLGSQFAAADEAIAIAASVARRTGARFTEPAIETVLRMFTSHR